MGVYLSDRAQAAPIPFFSDIANSGLTKWPTRPNGPLMNVVNDPILGAARKVVQMSLHEADGNGGGSTTPNPRMQLQAPNSLTEGSDFWVGFGVLLPAGYPNPTLSYGWNSVFQLMGTPTTGYPPMRIAFEGNTGGFGWQREPAMGGGWAWQITAQYGAWMDYALHIKMSANQAVGFVEIWTNFGSGWTQRSLAAAPGDTLVGKRLYTKTITPGAEANYMRTDVQNYRRLGQYDLGTLFHADHRMIVSTGNDAADIAAVNPGSYV